MTAPVSRHVTWPVSGWLARHRGLLPGGRTASELPRVSPAINGLRRRKPKDLGGCARLLRVVFYEGQYPAYWPEAPRAWLDGEDVMDAWVVERQGEILGHIAISKVGMDDVSGLRWREMTGHAPADLAAVSRMYVRSRVRRQGIGTALLDVAVSEIRARGLIPVLDVLSASKDAIRLYEAHGWRLLAMDPWRDKPHELRLHCYVLPPESISV